VNGRPPYDIVDFMPDMLPELADLWVAAWAATMPAIDFEARRAWFVAHLNAMHSAGVAILCARGEGDRIAAFVTLDRTCGHIDQLAVAPGKWGRGAALALLTEAKRRCAGGLHLDVNQDNPRAVRFYEREGFRRAAAGVNSASGLKTWRYEWRCAGSFSSDG
jgi:putative acetyltransferase